MTRTFEHFYPWLFAAASAAMFFAGGWTLPGDPNFSSLLSAAISVSSILVGFLATMKAILMAMPAAIQLVRDADYLEDLVSYLQTAITTSLLFCALNIASFFPSVASHTEVLSVVWGGLAVLASLSFWRVMQIMTLLLRRM